MVSKSNKKTSILGIVVVSILTVVLAGCTGPFTAQNRDDQFGSLALSGVSAGNLGAQTVFPSLVLEDIDSYTVTVKDGPGGGEDQVLEGLATDENGRLAEDAEFRDLVPGEWTLEVVGYDDTPEPSEILVSGSTTVEVVRGEYTAVTVSVFPNDDPAEGDGLGEWELDITWPEQTGADEYQTTDVVTGYTYTIHEIDVGEVASGSVDFSEPADGTENLYTLSLHDHLVANDASVDDNELAPGVYFFTVELTSENAAPYGTVARYDEVWYIYENLTSSRTVAEGTEVALDESDFSFGGGASIDVSIETEEDFAQFFQGLDETGETIASGEPFSMTVEVKEDEESDESVTPDEVTWRINAAELVVEATNDNGDENVLDIFDSANDRVVGQLIDIVNTDGELAFTPRYGASYNETSEEYEIDYDLDFPAGVSILVTLQVKHNGVYYSDSFSAEVTEPVE